MTENEIIGSPILADAKAIRKKSRIAKKIKSTIDLFF